MLGPEVPAAHANNKNGVEDGVSLYRVLIPTFLQQRNSILIQTIKVIGLYLERDRSP